ncbi:DUF3320 domain-containing protein (plasmid) [Halorutilales archaeon Cl-col2-1]
MSDIQGQIKDAREDLLDMSLRNRLLNFKEYKKSTAKIVNELPSEVYQHLVIDRNKMLFLPQGETLTYEEILPDIEDIIQVIEHDKTCRLCQSEPEVIDDKTGFLEDINSVQGGDHGYGLPIKEINELSDLTETDSDRREEYSNRYLQTPHKESNLQNRLYSITKDSEALIEDAGYNALYLAVGFLKWREAEAQEGSHKAPLILIPVKMERGGVRSDFSLQWNGEEITGNLSLDLKLSEQGFDLPEFTKPEEKIEIKEYLELIDENISDFDGWEVLPEIQLGFFDFTKFLMYQDLDPDNWPSNQKPSNHPLLKGILDNEETLSNPERFNEEKIDEKLSPVDVHNVKDADPSQISVIEDVKRGRDLVVEGPPGTGKSQTIVNMIAELLSEDKKILFVSEKMAALNVVKNRLDSVGIGDFCLELHSEEANKSKVLNELERVSKLSIEDPHIPKETFHKLERKRKKLDEYSDALGSPFGELNKTPYQLFGEKEEAYQHFEEIGKDFPKIDISNAESLSPQEHTESLNTIKELNSRLKKVHPIEDNPWYGCHPGQILPDERKEIEELLRNSTNSLDEIKKINEGLEEDFGVKRASTLNELDKSIETIEILAEDWDVEQETLQKPVWRDNPEKAMELVNDVEEFQDLRSNLSGRVTISSTESPEERISKYNNLHSSFKECLRPAWNDLEISDRPEDIDAKIESISESIDDIRKWEKSIRESIHTHKANNLADLHNLIKITKPISESINIHEELIRDSTWNEMPAEVESLTEKIEKKRKIQNDVGKRVDTERIDRDLPDLLTRYRELSSSYTRFVQLEWYNIKSEISDLYMGDVPSKSKKIEKDIEELMKLDNLKEELQDYDGEGQYLLEPVWNGVDTTPEEIREFSEWMLEIRKGIKRDLITEDTIKIISESNTKYNLDIAEGEQKIENLEGGFEYLSRLGLNSRKIFEKASDDNGLNHVSFESINPVINILQDISDIYVEKVPNVVNKVDSDIQDLIKLNEKRKNINKSSGGDSFGHIWEGENSDIEQLKEFYDWMSKFAQKLDQGELTEKSVEVFSNNSMDSEIEENKQAINKYKDDFDGSIRELDKKLQISSEEVWGSDIYEVELDSISSKLKTLEKSSEDLETWSNFDYTRKSTRDTIAEPVVELVNEGKLAPEDIVPCFKGNLADSLLTSVLKEREILAQFDEELHEDRIRDFQELDRKSIKINRKRVISKLIENKPQLMQGASKSSPVGTLLHEFGKERLHKPIRVLLQEAGDLIQDLKPCFMMSPLSVAKYFDPGTIDFDVVIFDEASQVRPEDAIGTILRGDQLVLFGDTKQLPPTSFFDNVTEPQDSDEKWEFKMKNVESILDLCRSSLPSRRLKWHYRSRHESLIAVSNEEFYDNELVVYPSPIQDSEDLGLEFRHLPDTTYDRGGSSTNREEARKVAEAAIQHYQDNPSKSLGIGTFSQKQQNAVLEEVERLRKENPEMDKYFSHDQEENFFVKNLERIQGDERDVIFISVGYGRDSDGKLHNNFGPLNQDGGWRRLNVLITRARERCVVFSNFTADELDVKSSSSRGVKSFKTFLDYAENGNLRSITEAGKDPESPFERSVIKFLQEEGYEVHPQVGSAGFRIDLAIADPENPGRYVLGIECDGASYHSSPVARERDRQRQEILEDRGWDIYRIWSTDWYRNRDRAKESLVEEVEKALNRGALTVSSDMNSKIEEDSEITELEDTEGSDTFSLEELSTKYEKTQNIGKINLSNHNPGELYSPIEEIIKTESPIHTDLLIHRLVSNSDVSRAGTKIQETIKKAADRLSRNDKIEKNGEFLYYKDKEIEVRERKSKRLKDIEWISEEEIEKGIRKILQNEIETSKDDLIKETSRLFGFGRTSQAVSDRISEIVDSLHSSKKIEEENGKLRLK